jgi:serine protease AprX
VSPKHGRPIGRRAARAVAASALSAVFLGAAIGPAHADVDASLGYDSLADKGSLNNIAEVVGAHDAYQRGFTGKGVGVALIDTGVAPVAGLTSGNVVNGPDLSFDSQNPALAHVDGFGHGTHLASIIAGRDAAGAPSSYLDPSHFAGIAPDATLVNVKVGAANGAVDITQVIAGIDWVVEHSRDNGLNIRVIDLAYGTDSTQNSSVDPLAYAVENAWKHGIVVVAAGGNDGDVTKTLDNPSRDPHVIAVGAMDDAGTVTSADDTVPTWSTRGTTARHVDVVAPGVSVLGTRVPGGTADVANPQARVGDRFARASGTSQASAVVAGEAALLIQDAPALLPDQVKQLLMSSASGISSTLPIFGGSGLTNLRSILPNPLGYLLHLVGNVLNGLFGTGWGSGNGSLEAARGDSHVVDGTVVLQGETDVFGRAWNGYGWARQTSSGQAWTGGSWRGEALTGSSWQDDAWPTTTWAGGDWAGMSWTSDGWDAKSWMAKSWMDNSWSAKSWMDQSWT